MDGKPGRPPFYTPGVKKYMLSLVRKTNVTRAFEILRADNRNPISKLRNFKVVPKPVRISKPTLLKWANDAGIELSVGRPRKAA